MNKIIHRICALLKHKLNLHFEIKIKTTPKFLIYSDSVVRKKMAPVQKNDPCAKKLSLGIKKFP